jgi:cytochrome c2
VKYRIFVLLAAISLALLGGCGPSREDVQWAIDATGGDPVRGKIALRHYGCISCHTIDGMQDSQALVGPPLTRMAGRSYLAGSLKNNAGNLIQWIRRPREIHPDTAMPDTGVTERDARDIAAYLYEYN